MKPFYLFMTESFVELDFDHSETGELKFIPSKKDKVLIKFNDTEKFKPEDFKTNGKYDHYEDELGGHILSFEIDPYSMELMEQEGCSFVHEDGHGNLRFTAFFNVDDAIILEDITDEEARLYYEVN